jgi:hypothetical protein
MPRIGLKAVGVNLDPIKDMTVAEIFGTGIIPVTECNKKLWKLIKDKALQVKLPVLNDK